MTTIKEQMERDRETGHWVLGAGAEWGAPRRGSTLTPEPSLTEEDEDEEDYMVEDDEEEKFDDDDLDEDDDDLDEDEPDDDLDDDEDDDDEDL